MKKITIVCMAIMILPMLTTSLSAQIYKYIDKNGQQRWTDDLSQVPIEQRKSAEHFENMGDTTNQKQSETVDSPKTDQPENSVELAPESLLKEKSELEKQYQQLVEEKKQLEQLKSEKDNAAHRKEVNEKILQYNTKAEQYQTRLNAYKAKVDAYNKKIMPTNETSAQ